MTDNLADHGMSLPTPELFDPVAIVGMGCRWPDDSNHPSELWEFLKAGKDAYRDFPPSRINKDAFYHEQRGRGGSFYSRGGCFLKSDPYQFDHTFFGINPQEATTMDPAQRKLLETVYEAFEAAGAPLDKLSGSMTGCFVGNFNRDYSQMQHRDSEYPEPYSITGGGDAILSNRINYVFNLKGPSLTIDTACSSSLYAIHLACSAIQNNECDGAVVGGSNLILTPDIQIFSSSLGAVSPTSRCHTFDKAADGYARADGIGVLYIKRLTDAIKDRDPIRAVIRGTAVNSNGKTGGITRPSSEGQEAVIRQAYQRGGLEFSTTSYLECHGTGTPVGDPLEVAAIARVFADGRSISDPLLLGSIKANIGHTEPASGIAGIMKVVLALEHGVIPQNVGFKILNPQIDLKGGRLKIVTENTSWPKASIRRASVNSFGYGGANAHLILDAPNSLLPGYQCTKTGSAGPEAAVSDSILSGIYGSNGFHEPDINDSAHVKKLTLQEDRLAKVGYHQDIRTQQGVFHRTQFLLVFSAHNHRTLERTRAAIQNEKNKYRLIDLAYTLSIRRSSFSIRNFVVATNEIVDEIKFSLESSTVQKSHRSSQMNVAFVFTGQGAQWPKMGLELMQTFPKYIDTIRYLDEVLSKLKDPPGWTLEGIFRKASREDMGKAELAQPATTALQIALVNLLVSWNIRPTAVVGHSSGEIAAAYASGHISIEDAIITAFLRGKIASQNQRDGLMLAIGAGEKEVRAMIDGLVRNVTLACLNSPESVTLSGDAQEVLAVEELFKEKKVFTKVLATGRNAYHSSHMKELGHEYETQLVSNTNLLSPTLSFLPKTAFFSSVKPVRSTMAAIRPSYWKRNLESPVLFQEAIERLLGSRQADVVVEIGPHAAMRGALQQIAASLIDTDTPQYYPTLVRGENPVTNILSTAGNLWATGHLVDLERVNAAESVDSDGTVRKETGNVIVDLPHYQWQYDKPLLRENRWTREWRLRKHARHDLLGSRVPGLSRSMPVWRNVITRKRLDWLGDHRLDSDIVFPAAGYLSMAIEAMTQMSEIDRNPSHEIELLELRDVHLDTALVIPEDDHGVELLFHLQPSKLGKSSNFKNYFRWLVTSVIRLGDKDIFVDHAYGQIGSAAGERDPQGGRHHCSLSSDKTNLMTKIWYESFARVGMNYGHLFQGLTCIVTPEDSKKTEAHTTLTFDTSESRYLIHPTVLDATIQLSIVASHSGSPSNLKKRFLPVVFESLLVRRPSQQDMVTPALVEASSESSSGRSSRDRRLVANLRMTGASNKVLVEVDNLHLLASESLASLAKASMPPKTDMPYSRMTWEPDFNSLTNTIVKRLFPPMLLDKGSVVPQLNFLALHQLIQFYVTNSEQFERISHQPSHLQKFLDWTTSKVRLAQNGHYADAEKILSYSISQRAEEIEKLSSTINTYSAESRTMCHIYRNLESIVRGEKTGIEVALQGNLLSIMYENGQIINEGNQRLASIVGLLSHKKSDLRILEIGAGTGSATREVLPALKGEGIYRRYKEYVYTDITPSFLKQAEERFQPYRGVTYQTFDMQKSAQSQHLESKFDLVLASNVVHASSDVLEAMRNIRRILQVGGKLILLEITQPNLFAGLLLGTFSDFWNGATDPNFPRYDGPFIGKDDWIKIFEHSGFGGIDFSLDDFEEHPGSTVIVGTAVDTTTLSVELEPPITDGLSIIYRTEPTGIVSEFTQFLVSKGVPVDLVSLSSSQTPRKAHQLYMVETERSLFTDINSVEWLNLRSILHQATRLLWVTNGGLISGREPSMSMAQGLLLGLKTELRRIHISTLDLDQDLSLNENLGDTWEIIFRHLNKSNDEFWGEFREKHGVIYRSSCQPDDALNEEWQRKGNNQVTTESRPLNHFQNIPLKVEIDQEVSQSVMFFEEDLDFQKSLRSDYVEVRVAATALYNKGIMVQNKSIGFNDTLVEFAGTVTQVGEEASLLVPGDRVCGIGFGNIGNFVRVQASYCQKIEATDAFEEMASLPATFCTAIYCLIDHARLSQGETVLIDADSDDLAAAAVQISKLCGANIYVVVTKEEKKQDLLLADLGLKEDHVLGPFMDGKNMWTGLLKETSGKGIDVVLCGEGSHKKQRYSQHIASFGKLVQIGKIEHKDGEEFDMDVFQQKSFSISIFNLHTFLQTKPALVTRLMKSVMQLYREAKIRPMPFTTIPASNIKHVVTSTVNSSARVTKQIITYDDSSASINVRKPLSRLEFDPEATYLLVGCLGGLGRHYSRWMVERGAKNLTYLSRSGSDRVESRNFLAKLLTYGVEVQMVKGDVSSFDDVQRAVAATTKPIKGVVQAALTLQDNHLETMTLEMYEATIKPRVQGTMNLHRATSHCSLDFFMMWSSWTAILGNPTQANYFSSCAFMDSFARYRHRMGLTAISLSLNVIRNVGQWTESLGPDYTKSLARNGFYGNSEDEFLSYCESAISECHAPQVGKWKYDHLAGAHLLAGIEPAGLHELSKTYPLKDMGWYHDSRFSNLLQAVNVLSSSCFNSEQLDTAGSTVDAQDTDEGSPVVDRIHKKVAQLLYVSKDDVDVMRGLSEYGIDSMIAGELRNWIFMTFGWNVSLFRLLNPGMTIETLGKGAETKE